MTTHTPGPWRLVTRSNQHGLAALAVAIDKPGCAPSWLPGKGFGLASTLTAQDEANARLIAAAPDMLAALKLCEAFCKGHQETPEKVVRYQQARAAIAKAEGAS